MKKFLTRALPLCLALLIFVGSLAVPAFATENDTAVLTGTWQFNDLIDFSLIAGESRLLAYFDFKFNGSVFNGLFFDAGSVLLASGTFNEGSGAYSWDDVLYENGYWYSSDRVIEIVGSAVVPSAFYDFFASNAVRIDSGAVLDSPNRDSIFSVFGGISAWLVSSIGTIMPMFYTEASGLTFIGTLAVAGFAVAVFFLIFMIIRRFLNFGG